MYALAAASAFLFKALDVFDIPYLQAALNTACGIGSAALIALVAVRAPERYGALHLDELWLVLDVVLVTWAVGASGGLASPWYLWYLANTAAAAFSKGPRATALVALGNVAGYLGLLAARGEIGFFDRPCLVALSRMAFLHAAGYFFLQGIIDVARSRREIKALRREDARRLADLERLAAALDQRTRELSAANRQVREKDRQKSRFLANVSHELRTPLNSILGFSQVLSTRFAQEMPERPRRFVANIHASGEHLLNVLDDVLDLSKIEAGRLSLAPERFAVRALVEEAITAVQGEAAPRGVVLRAEIADDLPELEADRVKVKQVVLNLLANAIRFSHEGGTVTVCAEALGERDEPLRSAGIRIRVVDEGIGIDPADHALVFDEFRQAERQKSRSGGTGLGLALVKSLVELHGGSVGLDSAPGRGSTFRVDLPARFRGSRARRDEDSTSGELPALGAPRVLLVDEEDPEAFRSALEQAGCLALSVLPGPEALRLSRTLRPAAIAAFVNSDGTFGLLRSLKGDPETRDIPVVLCAVAPNGVRGTAVAAHDLVFGPLRGDPVTAPPGRALPRLLVWGREPGAPDDGRTIVSSLAEARAACASGFPDTALLDITTDPDVLVLAAELSRAAARTGVPLLRLFVPGAEHQAPLVRRLESLAEEGEAPSDMAFLVGAVARWALLRPSRT